MDRLFFRLSFTFVALFLLGALTCQCVNSPPAAPVQLLPAYVDTFHVDTTFTVAERGYLATAVANLAAQTHGLVAIHLVFDFDQDAPAIPEFGDILIRCQPSDEPIADWDAEHLGSQLLGLTLVPKQDDKPTMVLLIPGRYSSGETFISVAMHELLHAAGVGHVDSPLGVDLMAPSVSIGAPPTCLHKADVAAVCGVYGCDVERMGYCD